VGNPLAVIAALAQELPTQPGPDATAGASRQILDQTGRIATMMRRIAEFATARGQGVEWVDVNAMVKAVCDFQSFEFRSRGKPIHFVPQADLPPCELVPDQLNEVLMSLLQAFAGGAPEAGASAPIRIETASHDGTAVIRLTHGPASGAEAAARAARLQALQRRVEEMGWRLSSVASTLTITVPATPREPGAA
jgi:C4-dicarboxylate-specific signal transduction histidine kinase